MNLTMSQILPYSPKFQQKFKDSESIFDAIYISLNGDMSGIGKDVKEQSNALFSLLLTFLYKNRNFSCNSFPL